MNTRELLTTTPAVYDQLQTALTSPSTGAGGERVSGSGTDPRLRAPIQLQVAEHRHTGLRGLRWWVHTLGAELDRRPHTLGPTPRVGSSPAAMCAWLLAGHQLLARDQGAELADNLTTWQRRARMLTDLPQLRGAIPLPTSCPASTDAEVWSCAGQVVLVLPADRDRTPWVTCQGCRARWDAIDLPQARHATVPVHVAADLLGVSVRTVQRHSDREAGQVQLGDLLDQLTG